MKRRTFVGGVGSGIAAMPLSLRAQRALIPVIGFMGASTAQEWSGWNAAFVQRLAELGWNEGRNIRTLYRWGEGQQQRFAEISEEFVKARVSVILTGGGAMPAALRATSEIPIVFAVANDPVDAGYVASLARPGGNATGMSLQAPDLVGKRMELLREIAPRARSVAIMANASNRGAARESIEAKSLASALGFIPEVLDVRSAADLWRALNGIERRVDALFVCRDALINSHEARIVELTSLRLPAMQNNREAVTKGALIAYGPNLAALFRRSAEIVDKILRGATPADIPVEQPTRFELAINMKTARALGIEVPPMLLARADEVIE